MDGEVDPNPFHCIGESIKNLQKHHATNIECRASARRPGRRLCDVIRGRDDIFHAARRKNYASFVLGVAHPRDQI